MLHAKSSFGLGCWTINCTTCSQSNDWLPAADISSCLWAYIFKENKITSLSKLYIIYDMITYDYIWREARCYWFRKLKLFWFKHLSKCLSTELLLISVQKREMVLSDLGVRIEGNFFFFSSPHVLNSRLPAGTLKSTIPFLLLSPLWF